MERGKQRQKELKGGKKKTAIVGNNFYPAFPIVFSSLVQYLRNSFKAI